jgi:TRAP-type C4-dicarboxylate transport system substrate-binding protein
VIPGAGHFDAVKKGAVDITLTPTAFYFDAIPQVMGMVCSRSTPLEERKNGYYDYLLKVHQKQNLFYLGRGATNAPFYIYMMRNVGRPQEISGLQIASPRGSIRLFPMALGASVVHMEQSDIYQALERKVVDGAILPLNNMLSYNIQEVLKYWIDYAVYTSASTGVIINLSTWNKMPKRFQDMMVEEYKKIEEKPSRQNVSRRHEAYYLFIRRCQTLC